MRKETAVLLQSEHPAITEMESKHLTPKNRISEFFGSGIDSDISGIAGDPPRGLLVGTKLVSQNLAGFWKFSTFCWFLDEEAFILPIQMLPKKSRDFHCIEASVFVRVPGAQEIPDSQT